MRAAHGWIGIENHYLVEEGIHRWAQRGDQRQRIEVRALLGKLGDLGAERCSRFGELLGFWSQLDVRRRVFGEALFFGLAQDVLDALESCRDGSKIIGAAGVSQRLGARDRVANNLSTISSISPR